jgi:ElaB/YqjD/DUF883 family membrane-anchored ribosome-binding protein
MTNYRMREASGAGEWMMNAMTRNPEGLLLLAAGAALLMRSGRGQLARSSGPDSSRWNRAGQQYARSQDQTTSTESISERVGEAARRAGEYVSEATDKVAETARSYASSAGEYADETSQAAMERSRRLAEQARETADYVVREQPWAVGLVGLLAGAAIAAAIPPTRIERRTLGEVGERLRSAAGAAGEQVMEAGIRAGERLSEVAEERGLTAEGLKKAAREVGETFTSTLAGEENGTAPASSQQKPREASRSSMQNPSHGSSSTENSQSETRSGDSPSSKDTRPPGSSGNSERRS